MSNPMTSDSEELVSDCHNAPMVVRGGLEGTNHYECTKCGQACNWQPVAQSEAPSVDGLREKLEWLILANGVDPNEMPSCLDKAVFDIEAKINRLIVKAYNNGFSDGKKIHPKYEVGDIGGNYRITERFRRVGKNIKYKVVCTLCGAPMFRYSNKFNLRHKDCGALSNNLSKEQLGEK